MTDRDGFYLLVHLFCTCWAYTCCGGGGLVHGVVVVWWAEGTGEVFFGGG